MLSATVRMPRVRAISPTAAKSVMERLGLTGVSTMMSRVLGRSTALRLARSVWSKVLTCTP
ncbi:hypothetical protein CDEF62S_03442 [Castellaniella defragrans]